VPLATARIGGSRLSRCRLRCPQRRLGRLPRPDDARSELVADPRGERYGDQVL